MGPRSHQKILRQVFILYKGREIVGGYEAGDDRSLRGAVIDAAKIPVFGTTEDNVAIDQIGLHARRAT